MQTHKQFEKILIIDDSINTINILGHLLSPFYQIQVSTTSRDIVKLASSHNPPHLILLDIMMPGIDGFEVCKNLKADAKTKNIPVIFITSFEDMDNETRGFEVGGADYITKPINPPVVLARVKAHLALYNQQLELEKKVKLRTSELWETRLQIIQRLCRAAEFKDNETGMHIIRMSKVSQLLGLRSGLTKTEAESLLNAAPMHDVGKIGIPDHILLKPDKFDESEWCYMKRHVEFGAEIIGKHHSGILAMARVIVLTHHEKWDGSGYPNGLSQERIPLVGRIVAIADVFDALISTRPYKKSWSVNHAINYIEDQKGKHFDPVLVNNFLDIIPDILKINEQYAET